MGKENLSKVILEPNGKKRRNVPCGYRLPTLAQTA